MILEAEGSGYPDTGTCIIAIWRKSCVKDFIFKFGELLEEGKLCCVTSQ